MGLTNLRLADGRTVDLTHLEVSRTYGGYLEGFPSAGVNDRHLARLAQRLTERYSHKGVHVLPSKRTTDATVTGFHGEPKEELPPIECVGIFEGAPITDPREAAWRMSLLVIAWHQDDLTLPFDDDAKARLAAVDWNRHARDCEM
jgi:hypothetical protein